MTTEFESTESPTPIQEGGSPFVSPNLSETQIVAGSYPVIETGIHQCGGKKKSKSKKVKKSSKSKKGKKSSKSKKGKTKKNKKGKKMN